MLSQQPLALHQAIEEKNLSKITALLKANANLEEKDQYGRTPLLAAVHTNGNIAVIDILVQHQAKIDAADSEGRTSLYFAAAHGREDIVKLLAAHGAHLNGQTKAGATALHAAAKYGRHQVAMTLMQHGASVDIKDAQQKTPLQIALENNKEDVANLLKASTQPLSLHDIVVANDGEALKRLLTQNCDVNQKDHYGRTALHLAAQHGLLPLVTLLLQHGALSDIPDNELRYPLYFAAGNGHREIVSLLLKNGADSNAQNKNGRSALHSAAFNGKEEIVRLLIKEGACLDLRDSSQQTAWQLAEQQGHGSIATVLKQVHFFNLIKAGQLLEVEALLKEMDLEVTGEGELTPFALACEEGQQAIAELLHAHHAKMQVQNDQGHSPLHLAALHGHEGLVKWLVEHKADLQAMDKDNNTALDLARRAGHFQMARYLAAQMPAISLPTVLSPDVTSTPALSTILAPQALPTVMAPAESKPLPTLMASTPTPKPQPKPQPTLISTPPVARPKPQATLGGSDPGVKFKPSAVSPVQMPAPKLKPTSGSPQPLALLPDASPKPRPMQPAKSPRAKPSPSFFQAPAPTFPSAAQVSVQLYPVAALIALQEESFRTKLIEIFKTYVSSLHSMARTSWEAKVRTTFNTYMPTGTLADCHFLRLMNALFNKNYLPPLQGSLIDVVHQARSTLLIEGWPIAIDGDIQNWEETILLFTQCSTNTLVQLEEAKQSLENQIGSLALQQLTNSTTTTALAYALNQERQAAPSGLMANERRALYYLDASEGRLKVDLSVLARLLPLARCDSRLVQGKLIGIGLRAFERHAERQWIICYWLRDVMRLALSTHVRQFDHEMMHKLLVTLLEKCPIKGENITSNVLFFGNNSDRTYILAFFELICALIEAAQVSGMMTLYTNVKERFDKVLAYMDGRAKKIKKDPIILADLRRLKRLEKLFKNDKTLLEKIKQFVSPLTGIVGSSVQIGASVGALVVTKGGDASSYLSILSAFCQIGRSIWQLVQMVPAPALYYKWHEQYRAAQEIIHHAMLIDEPWVWYESQMLLKQSCGSYKKNAVKQILSLLLAVGAQRGDLWPYFRPIIEAFQTQFAQNKKILIHAIATRLILDHLHTTSSGQKRELLNQESLWQLILNELQIQYSQRKERPLKAEASHYIHTIYTYRTYLDLVQQGLAENTSRRDEVMEALVANEERDEKEKEKEVSTPTDDLPPTAYLEDFFASLKLEKVMIKPN